MTTKESDLLIQRSALARARLHQSLASSKEDAKDAAQPAALVREHPVATLAWAFASAVVAGSWLQRWRRKSRERADANAQAARTRTNGSAAKGANGSARVAPKPKFSEHPVLASIQAAALLVAASARSFLVRQFTAAWQTESDATNGPAADVSPTRNRIPFE